MDGSVTIGRQTSPDWMPAPIVEIKSVNLALASWLGTRPSPGVSWTDCSRTSGCLFLADA
jgi:hypothetical protein